LQPAQDIDQYNGIYTPRERNGDALPGGKVACEYGRCRVGGISAAVVP